MPTLANSRNAKPPSAHVDSDDDDLDEFDDVLHQFQSRVQPKSPPPPATAMTSAPPASTLSIPPPTSTPSFSTAVIPSAPSVKSPTDASDSSPETRQKQDENVAQVHKALGGEEEGGKEDPLSADFANEFLRGMVSLMHELGADEGVDIRDELIGPGTDTDRVAKEGAGKNDIKKGPQDEKEAEQALKAAWEAMLLEEMNAMASTSGASKSTPSSSPSKSTSSPSASKRKSAKAKKTNKPPAPPTAPVPPTASAAPTAPAVPAASTAPAVPAAPTDSFQAHIQRTIDKLKASESDLTSSSDSLSADEEALLKQLEMLGLGKEGSSEAELQGALEAMMGQLMSKDLLYDPLKELDEKFPPYLDSHPELSALERERYLKQISCIKRLLKVFDEPNYNENDKKTGDLVVEIMTELQTHGSPPDEIMGPLPPGLTKGEDGLPELPEGCVVC